MKEKSIQAPRSVTWLALSVSLGCFALMASVMWLFEHAITLEDIGKVIEEPGRVKSWCTA